MIHFAASVVTAVALIEEANNTELSAEARI